NPMPEGGYTLIDTRGGGGINGGIGRSPTREPWSTFYVEADPLPAGAGKATVPGAQTGPPGTGFRGLGASGVVRATDGSPGRAGGLVKAADAAQAEARGPSAGGGEAVDWFEVLGSDAKRTQAFYAELFGWSVSDAGSPGYALVDTGAGRGIQGGLGSGEQAR